MLGSLHKNTLKTAVPRWFPNGSQMVPKRFPDGSQNGRVYRPESDLSRRLRDGVFLFAAYGYPRCCYRHISSWVRDAPILAFSGDLEISASHETTGGQ